MRSVYTEITQILGGMVVEADEKTYNIKLFPKPTFLVTDVPPPSQIIQEIRNIGDSVPSKIEKSLKSQISNLDELSKGRANTLNNSIKNVT